jgi:hypothetical protein
MNRRTTPAELNIKEPYRAGKAVVQFRPPSTCTPLHPRWPSLQGDGRPTRPGTRDTTMRFTDMFGYRPRSDGKELLQPATAPTAPCKPLQGPNRPNFPRGGVC